MKYKHVTLWFCCVVGLCLSAGVARAERMVALNAKGELLDMRSSQVKALAKEKLRTSKLKKAYRDGKISADEMFGKVYEPLLEPNKKQFEANRRNADKFRSMAQKAKAQDQDESARKFMAVGKLFFDYSEQNKRIVTAYSQGASAEIRIACDEIINIEKQIKAISRKDVPRDWLTPQEVASIRIVSARLYEDMQEGNDKIPRDDDDQQSSGKSGRAPKRPGALKN